MRTNNLHARVADQPPDIDELSSRLSALATRIDTLNGGRRPPRMRDTPVEPRGLSFVDRLLAPDPDIIRPAGSPPMAAASAHREPPAVRHGAEERQWPRLPIPDEDIQAPPQPDLSQQIRAQAVALREHDHRIAELTGVRDRQAAELSEARDHLERQALSIKGLREFNAERDSEVADLARKLLEAEADKVALESQLATALREANNSTVRLTVHEGALNDRAADLASANRLIDELTAGLAAAQVTIATQVADSEERLHQRYAADRKLLSADFERRIADLQALVAERDARVAELEQDKTAQAGEIAALRALIEDCRTELGAAAETVSGKDSHIAFLDTVLKVTRDNAEATVKELAAEFDRERDAFNREREELIVKAKAASAFQQDIAKLLPRLLQHRAAA